MVKYFIPIQAAVPISAPSNSLAIRILGVTKKASKADHLVQINKKSHDILYGLQCKIIDSVVEFTSDIDFSENQEVYVVTVVYIPIQKGKNPLQSNVHNICFSKQEAEKTFYEIRAKKNIQINGLECEAQVSIFTTKIT